MLPFETQNIGGRSQQKIFRSRPNLSIFVRPMPLRHHIRRIVDCNDIHSSWEWEWPLSGSSFTGLHSLNCISRQPILAYRRVFSVSSVQGHDRRIIWWNEVLRAIEWAIELWQKRNWKPKAPNISAGVCFPAWYCHRIMFPRKYGIVFIWRH